MELKPAALVVADISGYSRFVVFHKISQLHAEQIITDLIEAVVAKARQPLRLHKLEGDAAFFIAPLDGADADTFDGVIDQVTSFFGAFRETQARHFKNSIGGCRCKACQNLENLRLKALVHVGDVVHKQIGGFEEVGGSSVILIHRLLKNSVPGNEYLLLTEQAADCIQSPPFPVVAAHTEPVEDLGPVNVVVYRPDKAPTLERPKNGPPFTFDGMKDAVLTTWFAIANRVAKRGRSFRNLKNENAKALAAGLH